MWENVGQNGKKGQVTVQIVRTAKSWKDSVLEQNDQGMDNGERNVGTCARAYVGNCGNRQKNWLYGARNGQNVGICGQ